MTLSDSLRQTEHTILSTEAASSSGEGKWQGPLVPSLCWDPELFRSPGSAASTFLVSGGLCFIFKCIHVFLLSNQGRAWCHTVRTFRWGIFGGSNFLGHLKEIGVLCFWVTSVLGNWSDFATSSLCPDNRFNFIKKFISVRIFWGGGSTSKLLHPLI